MSWPFLETNIDSLDMEFFEIRDFKGQLRWLQSINTIKPDFLLTLNSKRVSVSVYKILVQFCFQLNLQRYFFKSTKLPFCQDAKVLFEEYKVKSIGVMLGMTGPSAKNVYVLNTSVHGVLFLKTAKSNMSFSLIEREAKALTMLNKKAVSFKTPYLLDTGKEFLLTTSMGAITQSRKWSGLHSDLINDLYSLGVERCSLQDFLGGEVDDRYLTVLGDTIDITYSHGDLTPWNLTLKQGQLHVIDWEMFGLRPLGYDFFHFHIQTQIMNTKNKAENIVNFIDKTYQIYFNEKSKIEFPKLQGLLLYLLTVRMEYNRIYSGEEQLHWQAIRALNIWEEMLDMVYERNIRESDK
jgi:tRNA A-37 threonylcarbamoyl transferase component Bud32